VRFSYWTGARFQTGKYAVAYFSFGSEGAAEAAGEKDRDARATALPCRCKRLAVATLWLVVLVVGKTFLHERVGLLKPGVREFFCEFTTGIEGHNN
jgi:hypothetical protein